MKLRVLILIVSIASFATGYSQSIDVPNVFTPNNDGVNDVFEVKSTGYENITCSIYNRHGGLVYRFHGLKGSWDGHTHAGEPCVEGVYFTIVEGVKPDGSTDVYQGNVQLIRK